MTRRYDAIIVGAGPGGLAAASVLAREGLSPLVIDRNALPGGTARGYSRKGFTFPAGPLGFSNPQTIRETLGGSGALDEQEFKRVEYLLDAFDATVPVSLSFDELLPNLVQHFPEEEKGIGAFFGEVREVCAGLRSTPEGERPVLGELGEASAAGRLSDLVRDDRLRRLLGSIGTGEPRLGFPLLASLWEIMCERGIWYPVGGFNALAARLAAEVTERGGEVRLRTPVTGIAVRKGRVRGVNLSDGSVLEAKAVISNADFKTTFLRLVEPDVQPPEWLAAVGRARVTSSNFQVALGVEESAVDLDAFREATRLIYRRKDVSRDPEWNAVEIDPRALSGQELEVCLWSGDDPALAPPGGATVVIRVAADHAHFARYRPAPWKRLPGYKEYKERLAGELIREVSTLIPGIERAAKVIDVATPLTFEERGGRHSGAVAGWSQRHEDLRDYTLRSLVLTPVSGLYMAGYQALSWLYRGGVPTAVLSGAAAAWSVLRVDGPIANVTIPGVN